MSEGETPHTRHIPAEIRRLCAAHPRRVAGSAAEYACQQDMAEQLRAWADDVTVEPYAVHPQAFIGSIALQATCDILSVAGFLLCAFAGVRAAGFVGAALLIVAAISWVCEYVLYRQPMDWLYPKRISHNVYAVRRAAETPARRMILTGHADAAYEMPLMQRVPVPVIGAMIAAADIGMFCCLALDVLTLCGAVSAGATVAFAVIECLLLIPFAFFLFFVDWRIVSDGANDNLTGCLLSMNVLKELAEADIRCPDTEVCCLLTGGEESGLRGAAAFAKAHKAALADVDTIVVSVDTIRETSELRVYPRGINGTQRNSRRVCELLKAAGERCGVAIGEAGFYPGGTDADAFSREGFEATALCGIRQTPTDYYHVRTDTADNLDADCIETTRSVLDEAVRMFARGEG